MASGNYRTTVALDLDSGETLSLEVECNVSGRFRPAFTAGDPDVCREAEYPEIEPLSARVESGVKLDLSTLSRAEDERLMHALTEAVYVDQAEPDEPIFGEDD